MNRLLLCFFSLTAFHVQAKAIEPVEVCQLECIKKFDLCLARNAANPAGAKKCLEQRTKCLCDCSKYELTGGGGADGRLPALTYEELPKE